MVNRFNFAYRLLRWSLLLAMCSVLVPYVWSRVASRSRCVQIRSRATSTRLPGKSTDDQASLRIASYNIAHGRGLPFVNWNGESKEIRRQRLDDIAAVLREMDADIVALNEVDFNASWSHKVNQAEYLAKQAGYAYWVEQRNLDFRIANYTWQFGNAILSRCPIKHAEPVQLPSYERWETFMAGKKRAVLAVIELEVDGISQQIGFASAHLSHRSEEVRNASAKMLCQVVAEKGMPVFVAGDMNSSPVGFPKSTMTGHGENAIQSFDESGLFQRHPMTVPEGAQMTFPADKAQQVIDWILIPKSFNLLQYRVLDSQLSDHRPVFLDVR